MFILDIPTLVNPSRDDIEQRFQAYESYLSALPTSFPARALAFATAPWHLDQADPRSLHDAWVEQFALRERAASEDAGRRTVDTEVVLLGPYHDRRVHLQHIEVTRYSLVGELRVRNSPAGHGDWLLDEVRMSQAGLVEHEVLFAGGARWFIECADIYCVHSVIPGLA